MFPFKNVKEFNDAIEARHCYSKPYEKFDLVEEEYNELYDEIDKVYTKAFWQATDYEDTMASMTKGEASAVLKEGIDLIYVLVGFLQYLGMDVEGAWEEVHKNNMLKLETGTFKNGKLHKDENHPKVNLLPYVSKDHPDD